MKCYVAIDIGGTKIKYCRVNEAGETSEVSSADTPHDVTGGQVISFLQSIVEKVWIEGVEGIGISTLGIVDEEGRVIGACDNFPELQNLNIKKALEDLFQKPVYVMNDVNAAALGEAYFGAGKQLDTFYCLTLGTGIGGALVLNKKVYLGANGMAGEAGYLWNHENERYEEKASVKAFLEQIDEQDKGDLGLHVFDSLIKGEERYKTLFQEWIEKVSEGIKDIIYIIDPGVIIIGGGISERGRFLTDAVQESLERQIMPDFKGKTKIIPAKHYNMANLLGAISPFV
ncbi:glucokinase [Aequitasia blattaphilus]|uniref:ROK family protein n=1 Tax=Aequitasia blattaphilus TaxID=2949332 RepID=A0ABT1EA29_9FIRM|nr:ROK family protein [Aequitasia blattaphilus]MCP1102709.1 ROK family protein [Aequitasia blattaphilus]MCR8615349.1 ROK family protein [Aequitasia blattaphilus]